MSSLFDLLPDEIVMKVIKMTMNYRIYYHHDYLVNSIRNISERFRRLASDKALWTGEIWIHGSDTQVKNLIHNFLGGGVKSISISAMKATISSAEILKMAEKCPNNESLWMNAKTITTWPLELNAPWLSLQELSIYRCELEYNLFQGVVLHQNMPNLKEFHWMFSGTRDHLRDSYVLPDMSGCQNLKIVELVNAKFTAPRIPFPRGLKTLKGNMCLPKYKASLQVYLENCLIDPRIRFLE